MVGFGKGFEVIKYTGKITHSTNLEGLYRLFNCFNEELPTCFSTRGSINRGIELVYEVENLEGLYTNYDADAGKDYGWDELRAVVSEEIIQNPIAIRLTNITKEELYCETEEIEEWQEEAYDFFEEFRLFQIIENK